MAQEVVMLGTGNAFLPYGRYHSFAMIDGKHIIDCPPTALASFRREGHAVSNIETIFITHVHGDHVFGFPFLLLERTYISDRANEKPLTVVAAKGVKERLKQLCDLAYPGSLESIFARIQWREEADDEFDFWRGLSKGIDIRRLVMSVRSHPFRDAHLKDRHGCCCNFLIEQLTRT